MKTLIIGKGQVGSSLFAVVSLYHETFIKDVEEIEVDGIEVLHLCYPYTEDFVETANEYGKKYNPTLIINHASVPVGTTEKIEGNVVYSPIRGKHPDLAKGIRTFDKFIAGEKKYVDIAKEYFNFCEIKTVCYGADKIKTLEFCKLMSNIRYGYEICFMQEAERFAKTLETDIETFKFFESSYNEGYKDLGEDYMIRPILYGGSIGGHCIMHNIDIIGQESEMLDWIQFSNYKKKTEEMQKKES